MDLFWETRNLTQAREDHLTCFVAAALEVDAAFRSAYGSRVLAPLAASGAVPRIFKVRTQVAFVVQHCRPDMILDLTDGRAVVCEHKLDAPETRQAAEDGETLEQLERYLELPHVDGVVYFRPSLKPPTDPVLHHPRYFHPPDAPHFLWRDLYESLENGRHDVTAWLRRGFERLGFTAPVRHVGELWPDKSKEVKENQRNFAKLWHSARAHLSEHWKIATGSRCELYLKPKALAPVSQVYVSPLAQGGSLLRIRAYAHDSSLGEVRRRLETVPDLPVQPDMTDGRLPNGTLFIDLLASLRLVLGNEANAAGQEVRLYRQVVPVVDALR